MFFIISLMIYLYMIRNITTKLQWDLFCNSTTLLLMPSQAFWGFGLELLCGTIFIFSTPGYIYFKVKQLRISENYGKPVHIYRKNIQTYFFASVISFIIVIFSFFSYCRADLDGLYIRDIRTLFAERRYSWNELSSVDINYLRTKSSYVTEYLLNFDRFSVDVQEGRFTSEMDRWENANTKIHAIVKKNHISLHKNIENYDNKIKEFLYLINEE